MHRYTVEVGWTNTRPVRPDEHRSRVTLMAHTGAGAELLALSMVSARAGTPGIRPCEMPTSSTVIDWEEGAP